MSNHKEQEHEATPDQEVNRAQEVGDSTVEGAEIESDLESLASELQKTKDQLLRKIAEFENFRRRTREEQSQLVQFGNEGLILDLLPVLDDFERSLQAGSEHHDFDAFFKGVEILRNKFSTTLEKRGLQPIESVGQMFDETYHEALMQVPGTGKEPGTIIDEVEKGYILNDKVIRHAKVTVAAEE